MRSKSARISEAWLVGVLAKAGRPLVRRFSELARESLISPGSWRCLEIVYRNKPRRLLDYYFLRSQSARGARSRLRVLQAAIRDSIRCFSGTATPISIISLGSGPGREVLDSLPIGPDGTWVEGTCVDKDPAALRYAREMANKRGLDGRAQFVRANALRLSGLTGYDVGVVSGLLDYFETQTAVALLERLRGCLSPGGIALVANMRRHRLASTMRVLGNWKLVYREPDELERLLVRAGFGQVECWLEPEGVFCIARGIFEP